MVITLDFDSSNPSSILGISTKQVAKFGFMPTLDVGVRRFKSYPPDND